MSKKQDSGAVDGVLEYLRKQNRPYSVVDILNNTHKEHGKTAIQKALDTLVASKKVCEKTYGKQKVYLVNQALFPTVSESEIKAMDAKVAELNHTLADAQKELRDADAELARLEATPRTKDASQLLAKTEDEVKSLSQKLKALSENPNQVTVEDREKVNKERERLLKEWRKRKRITNDILDSVLDGYPKGKKALYEEVGLETDEEVGVVQPKD